MANTERIAIQRARARSRLVAWQREPLMLARPVYFVPGWTDELGHSAWAKMEPWVAAVCANAAMRSHFVEFVGPDRTSPPAHPSFLEFGRDLARLVASDAEAQMLGADFVCHSMGGLDTLAAIALIDERPDDDLRRIAVARRVITLDTPFRGFSAAANDLFQTFVRARRPDEPAIFSQLRAMREDAPEIAAAWAARDGFLAGVEGFWARGADNAGGLIEVPHESASFGRAEDFAPAVRSRYRGYRAWEGTSHSGPSGVTSDLRAIAEVLEILTG
jgi:hypothetical protein